MLRSVLHLGAAVAVGALLLPGAAPAAPGPGLAYDEIVRVVLGATPPPPGSFQADLAALNPAPAGAAAASPIPAPRRGFNLGQLASAFVGGGNNANASSSSSGGNPLAAALSGVGAAFQSFLAPHLMRYAYWNGWQRVDDVAAQTATIRKCDIGQVMHLDLAHKTYTINDPSNEPAAAPAVRPGAPARPSAPGTPAPPGTVTITLSSTTTALGAMQLDNQATTGFDTMTALTMSQATGSCRNGSVTMRRVNYYAQLAEPAVNSCPIQARPPIPERETDVVTPPEGGCKPTFSTQQNGPTPPSGRLALYSLLTTAAAGASPAPSNGSVPPAGMSFLTERGNIRTLGPGDASLFDVPPGFTKQ